MLLWVLLPLGAVFFLVLLAGGAYLFLAQDAAEANVFYEPPIEPGPDPFTDPADVDADAAGSTIPEPESPDDGPEAAGPFGGTGSNTVCDRELLIEFLEANPDRLRAWAAVFELDPALVADFIRSLTPATLSEDTRFTNHRFSDGRAVPIQSILPAGTAVLVDDDGHVRVRCRCGNPLLEPERIAQAICDGCPSGYVAPALLRSTERPSIVVVRNPPPAEEPETVVRLYELPQTPTPEPTPEPTPAPTPPPTPAPTPTPPPRDAPTYPNVAGSFQLTNMAPDEPGYCPEIPPTLTIVQDGPNLTFHFGDITTTATMDQQGGFSRPPPNPIEGDFVDNFNTVRVNYQAPGCTLVAWGNRTR